ncbi:Bug family tripartite tricarboxylate transporter substrate binding protein [Roseomonas vinacea]|uniref:Bug family tripartite tricarboxylate transporter substrate binding protein n=1 Tax=Muricoccus vinaceus TaxID=424704 RepID=A0ABV6IRF0_9PROT
MAPPRSPARRPTAPPPSLTPTSTSWLAASCAPNLRPGRGLHARRPLGNRPYGAGRQSPHHAGRRRGRLRRSYEGLARQGLLRQLCPRCHGPPVDQEFQTAGHRRRSRALLPRHCPALTDVLSGNTALRVAPLGSALPHIEADRLRAFAIMGAKGSNRAPNIPTTAEQGMPGLDFTLWYAVWGPKGLPDSEADRLNAAVQTLARDPNTRARIADQGAEPVAEDRAAFARFVDAGSERNARIAQVAGIQPE